MNDLLSTRWHDDGRPFKWPCVFGRMAPRVLDIGCGDGRFLIASATARIDYDHVGIELVEPMVARGVQEAARRKLRNVRFVVADAVCWLFERFDEASLDEVHIYHPQPYYDPAQADLGMLTAAFFERLYRVLKAEGLLVLQTDNRRYGKYLLEAACKHFAIKIQDEPWLDAPTGRTRREEVAFRKKLPILRVTGRPRSAPLDIEPPQPYFEPGRPGLRAVRAARQRRP